MTPKAALIELLGRVGAGRGTVALISDHELSRWPSAAVLAMKAKRLIAKARPAGSAVCPGCERECVMPVYSLPNAKRNPPAFIVCDKRSDINRVSVPTERLTNSDVFAGPIGRSAIRRLRCKSRVQQGQAIGRDDRAERTCAHRSTLGALSIHRGVVPVACNGSLILDVAKGG